jgi:hypothetical protein
LACTWRIRHKLMLGMGLVVAIMALLLGGALYGLASYRFAMGTCVRKLDEMKLAENVKEEIRKLRLSSARPEHQAGELQAQIPRVEKSLEEYAVQLKDTVDSGRAPNEGKQEQALVATLQKDMHELRQELQKDTERGHVIRDNADWLQARPAIRKRIDDAEIHVNDLIGTITIVISRSTAITRDDARRSIMLVSITGVLAVLLIAGSLSRSATWSRASAELRVAISSIVSRSTPATRSRIWQKPTTR